MDLAEGDEIVFSKYGGTEIRLGDDDYLILRESDVLAKVVSRLRQGLEEEEGTGRRGRLRTETEETEWLTKS